MEPEAVAVAAMERTADASDWASLRSEVPWASVWASAPALKTVSARTTEADWRRILLN